MVAEQVLLESMDRGLLAMTTNDKEAATAFAEKRVAAFRGR